MANMKRKFANLIPASYSKSYTVGVWMLYLFVSLIFATRNVKSRYDICEAKNWQT